MSNERDPKELVLTKKDFSNCGWKAVLAEKTHKHYTSMSSAFSDAMKKADDEDRPAHGKILWLLSVACSMIFSRKKPQSLNQPFEPLFQIKDRRGLIPDDLSEADIDFFAEIADTIDDPRLKARLADLVWLRRKGSKEGVLCVKMAIDAYRALPLNPETWYPWDECLERAIVLAKSIGKEAGDRLVKIESSVIDAFRSGGEGLFCLNLADILKSHDLGKDHATMIAQRLESLGRELGKENSFLDAGRYFEASVGWFNMSGDNAKSVEMTVEWAESRVKEAVARASSADPSNMVAAAHYEQAIQIYRSIPGSERAKYGVDERIDELMALLSKSNKKSLDEMAHFSSDSVDISRFIENSRNAVKGKNPTEALWEFVNIYHVSYKELRELVIKEFQDYPMLGLLPMSHMSQDGRVVDKQPGGFNISDDRIHFGMIQTYDTFHVGAGVQAFIGPALEALLSEHRLREDDFVNLAKQSPFVEMTGRERLLGKALYAGYDLDFATALHILVPQLEHMVRFHLKERGISTTKLYENGIEDEISLKALMEKPETEEIFGKDLRFEIQALFCEPAGGNLRNKIAHGLIDNHEEYRSYQVIYAWWLVLKIVLLSSWKSGTLAPKSDKLQEG